jgi:nitroreductase
MSTNCMREIAARFACRAFTGDSIDTEALRCVLNAGRLAPSGFGLEPWRFLSVKEATLREQVAEACFSQPPAATAPVLIVLAALVESLRPGNRFVKRQLEAEAGDGDPALVMDAYRALYESTDIALWAVGQCQIAAAFMMLEAVHQQLATCPIGGFDEQKLALALNLPAGEKPALVLALGHCAQPQGARRRRASAEVIAHLGK